jgi:hypothetical protein
MLRIVVPQAQTDDSIFCSLTTYHEVVVYRQYDHFLAISDSLDAKNF